jgi:hypothetical protein
MNAHFSTPDPRHLLGACPQACPTAFSRLNELLTSVSWVGETYRTSVRALSAPGVNENFGGLAG